MSITSIPRVRPSVALIATALRIFGGRGKKKKRIKSLH